MAAAECFVSLRMILNLVDISALYTHIPFNEFQHTRLYRFDNFIHTSVRGSSENALFMQKNIFFFVKYIIIAFSLIIDIKTFFKVTVCHSTMR